MTDNRRQTEILDMTDNPISCLNDFFEHEVPIFIWNFYENFWVTWNLPSAEGDNS